MTSTVHVIAYEFSIHGLKTEVHTEIRAFGYDYWFEINGAKKIKSRNKQKQPYDGSNYTMTEFIGLSIFGQKIRKFRLWGDKSYAEGV